MENHLPSLDAAFHALADTTRRAVLSRLARGPATVSELAAPFEMGLPSFLKHLRILEEDGLIFTEKQGRVRTCRVNAKRLALAEGWLARQRRAWEAQADRLANYVETKMTKGANHGR